MQAQDIRKQLRMKLIVTNDDSVMAIGIRALADYLSRDHEIFVIAPDNERSGVSQSITYRRPVFAKKFAVTKDVSGMGVNGYPVDCVKLALSELCPFVPDAVVSGINNGLNVGRNVAHSGTVAGALAGSAAGYPSIAISLDHSEHEADYRRAIELVWPVCRSMLLRPEAAGRTLNVNVPLKALEGNPDFHVVPANYNPMGNQFMKGNDPNGRPFFWQSNEPAPLPMSMLSDIEVVTHGGVSITPLTHDLTVHSELDAWGRHLVESHQRKPEASSSRS
jgi:5'-nucleotidase